MPGSFSRGLPYRREDNRMSSPNGGRHIFRKPQVEEYDLKFKVRPLPDENYKVTLLMKTIRFVVYVSGDSRELNSLLNLVQTIKTKEQPNVSIFNINFEDGRAGDQIREHRYDGFVEEVGNEDQT